MSELHQRFTLQWNQWRQKRYSTPSAVTKTKTPSSSQHLRKVNYGEDMSNILACVLNDRESVLLF